MINCQFDLLILYINSFFVLKCYWPEFQDFYVNSLLIFMEKLYIYDTLTLIWIFVHIKKRNSFNKIVNLTNILFKSNLYNSIVQAGFI